MDVKDSISVTLKTIDGKETKDQSAKNIFSYKPFSNTFSSIPGSFSGRFPLIGKSVFGRLSVEL